MRLEQQTIPIGQAARQMGSEGYKPIFQIEDPLKTKYSDPEEALRVWNGAMEAERFILIAVLINQSFSEIEKQVVTRPPYGLIKGNPLDFQVVTNFPRINPYEFLTATVKDTLIDGFERMIQDITYQGDKHPVAQAYARFSDWVDFHNTYLTKTVAHEKCNIVTPKDGITPGIDAATNWMGLILKMIPQRYRKDVSSDSVVTEMQNIASQSYPLLGKLASYDLLTFNCVGFAIAELEDPQHQGEIDPNAFMIKEGRRGLHLDFSAQAEDAITVKIAKMHDRISLNPKIGCPALVNFGNGSVVSRLWNKYIEISPEIYRQ